MSGQQLLRIELFGGGVKMGWRPLIDLEHGTLCRQFSLDPNRYYFDLPSSARGVGSTVSGAGGSGRGRRRIEGFIFEAGHDRPVGKIVFATEGERIRDDNPCSREDFERLG